MKTSCGERLLLLLGMLVAAAPPTHAQTKMFKCIIDGRTVYQQTACPVNPQADDVKPLAEAASAYRPPASRPSARATARAATPSASAASNSQTQAETTGARGKIER